MSSLVMSENENMDDNENKKNKNDKKNENENEKEEEKTCAICYDVLNTSNCVATECKHHFCNKCFFKWLRESDTCPMCRTSYTKYHKWHYDVIDYNAVSDEFNAWRNLLNENRRIIEKRHALNKGVEAVNKKIRDKMKSLTRIDEMYEYNKGYQIGAYMMITEHDLYNAVYDGYASQSWRNGFANGLKFKYNIDILGDFIYKPDPLVDKYKKRIFQALHNGEIKTSEFEKFNTLDKLLAYVYSRLKRETVYDVSLLFSNTKRRRKKDSSYQQPYLNYYDCIENKEWERCNSLFVDFTAIEGKLYKLPYYVNDKNEIVFYPYSIALKLKHEGFKYLHEGMTIKKKSGIPEWNKASEEEMNDRKIVTIKNRKL